MQEEKEDQGSLEGQEAKEVKEVSAVLSKFPKLTSGSVKIDIP